MIRTVSSCLKITLFEKETKKCNYIFNHSYKLISFIKRIFMQNDLNTKRFIHQIPDCVFDTNISFVELKLFLLICRFNYSGQNSTFSNRYAALKLNVSLRTIQRSILHLEELKMIQKRTFTLYEKNKKTPKRVLQVTYSPIFNTEKDGLDCG